MDPVTVTSAVAGAAQAGGKIAQGIDSIFGSGKSHISRADWQRMGEFAKQQENFENLTQIRTRDALKAGINPLAALGQSANITPSYSNSEKSGKDFSSLGDGLAGLAKFFSKSEREATSLSLESQRLENEYKRAQIDHLRNMNPGITGGSYTRGVSTSGHGGPVETVPADAITEGRVPANMILNTPHGGMIVPSRDAADALDVEFGVVNPLAFEWWFKNKFPNWWKVLGAPFRAQRRLQNPKKYFDKWGIKY